MAGEARSGQDANGLDRKGKDRSGVEPTGEECIGDYMKIERKWKSGSHLNHLDVNAVAEEINELIEENLGSYTARELREKAKNPNSAMHNGIEWDIEKAADLYQVDQARTISRSVVTHYIKDTGEPPLEIRDYIAVSFREDDTGKQYTNRNAVLQSEDLRIEFLTAAFRDMKNFEKKYEFITEFKAIFDAMHVVIEANEKEIN